MYDILMFKVLGQSMRLPGAQPAESSTQKRSLHLHSAIESLFMFLFLLPEAGEQFPFGAH